MLAENFVIIKSTNLHPIAGFDKTRLIKNNNTLNYYYRARVSLLFSNSEFRTFAEFAKKCSLKWKIKNRKFFCLNIFSMTSRKMVLDLRWPSLLQIRGQRSKNRKWVFIVFDVIDHGESEFDVHLTSWPLHDPQKLILG
jgi:hypothetical protein